MPFSLIPNEFYVTHGSASSPVSDLNAFDLALMNAGIAEQNLVAVSSVLPPGVRHVPYRELPMGAVTHCVLAQIRGRGGDRISSGIGYAFREDGVGGYVAEGHMFGSEVALATELETKVREMGRMRGVALGPPTVVTNEIVVPEGHNGCSIVALVFCGYRD